MSINDRMFQIMKEKNITQSQLSRMTGIAVQTISDWKNKKTNPGADKIMRVCRALEITPEELLAGESPEPRKKAKPKTDNELQLMIDYQHLSSVQKKRLLAYAEMLISTKESDESKR